MSQDYEQIPPRDSWDPIDEALYGPDDLYRVEVEEADRLRLRAIRFSLNYHYTRNRFYHTLCEQRGFAPEDVKTLDDLAKVPLIPDAIFKQYPEPEKLVAWLRGISSDDVKYPSVVGSSYVEIIDRLNEHGLKVIFSSGTSGRSTFLPRDQITLSREAYFRVHFRRLIQQDDPEDYVVSLGPDYRKIHPNWVIAHSVGADLRICQEDRIYCLMDIKATTDTIQFVMGMVKGKRQVEKGEIEKAELTWVQMLESLSEKGVKGQVSGAVFLMTEVLSKMEDSGKMLTLGDRWILYTGGGGWTIPKEDFWKKAVRVLGIPDKNCRDIYGLTESVVAFPSCEGHHYHIAHTLFHPFVLDEDLEPVGFGEYGRFAFIDTLAHAYPGCVITGDKVKLLESCPSCDRPGPVISPLITRAPGAEDRGCAAMVRKLMEEEAAKP